MKKTTSLLDINFDLHSPIFKYCITIIIGSISVLSFAPYGIYLIPYFTLMGLFWLWAYDDPKTAFLRGWLFGMGLMLPGTFWLRISISQFGGVNPLMANVATFGFIAFVSMYFGLAGWIGCRITKHVSLRLILSFPAAWCGIEWLRGWLFTGFPWLAIGYSQIDSPLGLGFAPIVGVYGISFLIAMNAGVALFSIINWHTKSLYAIYGFVFIALLWSSGLLLTQVPWSVPYRQPFYASLIQPSIPQSLKWDPDKLIPTLKTYTSLTKQASGTLIVWPETAVPNFLHRVENEWLNPLTQTLAARGAYLLVGTPVLDPNEQAYYNGAVLLGKNRADYYKRHLVPFGEYLPLKALIGNLLKFLKIPMSNFTPGALNSHSIRIGEHTVGVSICYEDAFGEEIRTALPAASYLVNLSNDGWFGDSLAPHQHLEISRMRAVETARPLIRATNSGISAIIGPRGEIHASTQVFTSTILTGIVQPMQGVTPFILWGDKAALAIAAILAVMAWIFSNWEFIR